MLVELSSPNSEFKHLGLAFIQPSNSNENIKLFPRLAARLGNEVTV